jgi:hypothetical protein
MKSAVNHQRLYMRSIPAGGSSLSVTSEDFACDTDFLHSSANFEEAKEINRSQS